MGLTHFPNGIQTSHIVGGAGMRARMTTGNIFCVDSGASGRGDAAGKGTDPSTPFATLAFALLNVNGRLTANNGDVVYLMPGHAESVIAGGTITADIAGISVIGLGSGSDRPTITFSTATSADININAANIYMENILFIAGIDALTGPLDINAADFTMFDCEMRDASAIQTVRWILGNASADNMKILNCVHRGQDAAGATAWITLNGADGVVIADCFSQGDMSAANIENITAAATDVLITRNHLENSNAVDVNIEGFAAMSGMVSHNNCRTATNAISTWINTLGALSLFENYGVNLDGETGVLIGVPSV